MSRAELEDERRFLLESLRDLEREREAGEIAPDDYAALRDDYTARAAEVLRALEEGELEPEPTGADGGEGAGHERATDRDTDDDTSAARPSRSLKLVAAVLLVGMVAAALASVFLFAGERQPGEPATGSIPDAPADRLALAHQLEGQGQALEALKLYDAVLRDDPDNVEALTYRGWLLKLAGLPDPAQESLDKAVTLDPRYPDAHFFRGMVLYQDRKDPAAAIPEFEAFLALTPPSEVASAVQEVLDRAKRDLAASTTAPTTTAPAP